MSSSMQETIQKVRANLVPLIEEHRKEFDASSGVDYLRVKNSLLLSYLIDLVVLLRDRTKGDSKEATTARLIEMRTALDKLKNMDAKLKYQIEKLMSLQQNGGFAAQGGEDDPLQYRPQLGLDDDDKNGNDENDNGNDSSLNEPEQEEDDDDDDIAMARRTMAQSRQTEDQAESIYKAPRLTAVPFTHDKIDQAAAREKRQRQRLRASEVAQALRHELGDAPEVEDTNLPTTSQARRFEKKQSEKLQYEEDNFVRLTVTREEKKERKRIQREEQSNLNSVVRNVDSLVLRDIGDDRGEVRGPMEGDDEADGWQDARHANGKRRKVRMDGHGRVMPGGKMKKPQAKNTYQEALFSSSSKKNNKKGKGKKRR